MTEPPALEPSSPLVEEQHSCEIVSFEERQIVQCDLCEGHFPQVDLCNSRCESCTEWQLLADAVDRFLFWTRT